MSLPPASGDWPDPSAGSPDPASPPPPGSGWPDPHPANPPGLPGAAGPGAGPPPAPAHPAGGYGPPARPPGYGYPPFPYPHPYPAPPRTNAMAVAALVVSLASLTVMGIAAPVGAILGHVARRQIRERGEEGDGMALAGIIVGWIVTGLLAGAVLLCCVGPLGTVFLRQ